MERKFIFSEGEFYHVYNRGTEKREIFLNKNDYQRFIKLLFLSNGTKPIILKDLPQGRSLGEIDRGEQLVHIGAYCLMPNHFHILVKETREGGITKFMSKLSTAYSMYFNKINGRTGSLFEGRFKATHVNNDNYLKYLFSYIHLNPVKIIEPKWKEAGITNKKQAEQYIKNYKYSSYLDYIGKSRLEGVILDKKSFPEYFSSFVDFRNFIEEWLNFKNESPKPQGRSLGFR